MIKDVVNETIPIDPNWQHWKYDTRLKGFWNVDDPNCDGTIFFMTLNCYREFIRMAQLYGDPED